MLDRLLGEESDPEDVEGVCCVAILEKDRVRGLC